jgi:hypothetical protein
MNRNAYEKKWVLLNAIYFKQVLAQNDASQRAPSPIQKTAISTMTVPVHQATFIWIRQVTPVRQYTIAHVSDVYA